MHTHSVLLNAYQGPKGIPNTVQIQETCCWEEVHQEELSPTCLCLLAFKLTAMMDLISDKPLYSLWSEYCVYSGQMCSGSRHIKKNVITCSQISSFWRGRGFSVLSFYFSTQSWKMSLLTGRNGGEGKSRELNTALNTMENQ